MMTQVLPKVYVKRLVALELDKIGLLFCRHRPNNQLAYHLWTLASKEHWPYSCSLPFFEAYGFALQIKVKTFIKERIWPTAPQTQPKNKALKGSYQSRRGEGWRWRLRAGRFLRTHKAARGWCSAVLWALGNFTLGFGLSLQKGVS